MINFQEIFGVICHGLFLCSMSFRWEVELLTINLYFQNLCIRVLYLCKYCSFTMFSYHFFFSRGRPLWSCEDITPRTLNTQSAVQVEYFLKLVIKYFQELSPKAFVEQRWSQVALQVALSCSSRHYAGRSFQVRIYAIYVHCQKIYNLYIRD